MYQQTGAGHCYICHATFTEGFIEHRHIHDEPKNPTPGDCKDCAPGARWSVDKTLSDNKKSIMKETKKLTRIEEAILLLADYLEDPTHDQYQVKKHIMEILGVELKPNEQSK